MRKNKVYKLKAKGEEYFVASSNYKRAVRLLAEELDINKYITRAISGKVLLKPKPATKADYLKMDIEEGVIDKNSISGYFCGDKEDIKGLDQMVKEYIDDKLEEKIHKAVENYFSGRVPF